MQLTSLWSRDRKQENRAALLLALGVIGGDKALAIIKRGLDSHKETVRRAACQALASLRDPAQGSRLIARLGDSDRDVVRYALIGYRSCVIPTSSRRFASVACSSTTTSRFALSPSRRSAGKGTDKAIVTLATFAGRRRSPTLRRVLAFALARNDGAAARQIVATLARDADSEVVRAVLCANLIRRGRGAVDVKADVDGHVDSALEIALSRGDATLRKTAVDIVVYLDVAKGADVVRKILAAKGEDRAVVDHAAALIALFDRGDLARDFVAARLQVAVDDLGGSPEWNLIPCGPRSLPAGRANRPSTDAPRTRSRAGRR